MDDQFLAAIRAAPDDDLPRLVYADYLEERGDAARAEFIRAQVELATLNETSGRLPLLEDRAHELLARHEPAWLGGVAAQLSEWEFRRGFLDQAEFNTPDLDADAVAAHPITRLTPCVNGIAPDSRRISPPSATSI